MSGIAPQEFLYLVPEIVLAVAGMGLLVAGSFGRGGYRMCTLAAAVALAVTLLLVFSVQGRVEGPTVVLAGMFVLDGFAFFWKILFLISSILVVILSERFLNDGGYRPGEFYALILLATTGMMLMVS
ncbi:MAG: NADH-quinone oxidoreductase subunit N, partial [Acidobacteriota bacterium]|nr:NADH-quinone oxidoreductase subunit N [Acidobacteriota bacterium]